MAWIARSVRSPARHFPRPSEVAFFGWLPVIVVGVVFFSDLRWGGSLGDFAIFRTAAREVLHGHSPFVAPDPHALVRNDKFVYPPITAFLFAPFAVLPFEAARVSILVLAVAAILAALWLLRVSDWRCYGLALMSAPVLGSISVGTLSPFLLLGAAATWRLRDRPLAVGSAAALTGVAKLVLWPLGVWLLATRRIRAAALTACLAVVLLAGGWAAIGFAGLSGYPHLLRVLADVEAAQSYSLVGLIRLSGRAAEILSLVLAVLVVAGTVAAARGRDGDRRSFSVAIAGALLATPVLWLHYFVLLLIPLALYRPRLSALWFAPLAFWVTPYAHSDGTRWVTGYALVVAALLVLSTLASRLRSAGTAASMS